MISDNCKGILMRSQHQPQVFVKLMELIIQSDEHNLYDQECDSGHNFLQFIGPVTGRLYYLLASNQARYTNDTLHRERHRKRPEPAEVQEPWVEDDSSGRQKETSNQRKQRKLQSN